jgi:hypothetical protein
VQVVAAQRLRYHTSDRLPLEPAAVRLRKLVVDPYQLLDMPCLCVARKDKGLPYMEIFLLCEKSYALLLLPIMAHITYVCTFGFLGHALQLSASIVDPAFLL